MNILYLECRGCYFFNGDKIDQFSNVGNYRVGIYNKEIQAKNGRAYTLEFTHYDKREMRYTDKRNGKPLKHPKCEIVLENALHIDTEFTDENGISWRDLTIEKQVHDKNLTFTKENILKVVNKISVEQYRKMVLVSADEIIPKIKTIYNMGGYREKDIIDNLVEVKTKEYNKNYWVFTFISADNDTFDYEYYSNRITG